MIPFSGDGLLLDIEGTTSSIAFVHEVMFPYARQALDAYLRDHGDTPEARAAFEQIARDAGHASLDEWASGADPRPLIRAEVLRLMDGDVKATGLKQLQGLLWRAGFENGALRAPVYDDVVPALRAWQAAGLDVRIYSSGSVGAQRLFFGHTTHGNLLPYFRGHYDTTTGGKKDPESYRRIARDYGRPAAALLFLSDVPAELDAARTAGWQTALCRRPGNAPVPPDHGHPELHAFDEIRLTGR